MSEHAPTPAAPTPAPRTAVDLVVLITLPLLVLVWLVGTPVLAYGWAITAAPFFGEQPDADELRVAHRLLVGAVVTAVLTPLVAIILGVVRRHRVAVGVGVAMVLVGVALLVWVGLALR